MILLRILLFPLAVLYDFVTRIINRLYDLEIKPSAGFEIPVIGVGNLTVGGTGKTPMIEYLVRLLDGYRVATLSRGYRRSTRGIRIASPEDNAQTLGDEPYQFYNKYKESVTVAVGEDRALAIPHILQAAPETRVVLLDDAFQHRRVKLGFNILLTDYRRPFYKDFVLPSGRLREARKGAARADAIVVTKCPDDLADAEMTAITDAVRRYAGAPVFFAGIHYGRPLPFGGHAAPWTPQVVLVTGIADARPLVEYVKKHYTLAGHLAYPDHHAYTGEDLERIRRALPPDAVIVTTEKDMVKINAPALAACSAGLPLFYLPIEVDFVKNGEDFDALVHHAIQDKR